MGSAAETQARRAFHEYRWVLWAVLAVACVVLAFLMHDRWQIVFISLAVLVGALAALPLLRRKDVGGMSDDVHQEAVAEVSELRAQVSTLTADLAASRAKLDAARADADDAGHDAEMFAALEARVAETDRERAAAEARAVAAETRAEELDALGDRVAVAERRALDAERRLQELSEQVEARRSGTKEPSQNDTAEANDLRARLARTAARKKPGGPESS